MEHETLDKSVLVELFDDAVKEMVRMIPGDTDAVKKEFVGKELTKALVFFEDKVPVIKEFVDIPGVEDLEKDAVAVFVDWAWENLPNGQATPK